MQSSNLCRREKYAEDGEDERGVPKAMGEPECGLDCVSREGTDDGGGKECALLLPCSVAGLGIKWTGIAYGDGHELQLYELPFSPESDEADELERLW